MNEQIHPLIEPLVEPLTRREHEILGLLAQGYSGPEIAEQLTLAVSSVKWHIQQVYGKLGVNSKRQALTRAKELGLLGTALPAAPPKPASAPPHNLPVQVTRFFGRETEIAHINERLSEYRLITLTGAGGVGKTRLALRAAESILGHFPEGVRLIELAPLSDPALVPQQVASSLGLRDEPGRPILDTLTHFLRDRQLLLILDNCEHLLTACAQLAAGVLRACPDVKVLATSREALGLDGEALVAVPSLSFPDPQHLPALETLNAYTALSLFVDRARAILPGYALTPHNASHLARICQRLDGIPLALEMAAARIRLLNAETLAARLDDAFDVLTSGNRMALPKHQTLRGMIDWSYTLLSDEERLLLQRLSVFAGGCTLEAAEAVCAGEGLEASEVLERLGMLVSKSLVVADRLEEEEARYHLLGMVRQYAREKLELAGEGAGWQARHRDYFLAFAETSILEEQTQEQRTWDRKLAAEQDNFREALEWSFRNLSEAEAGPRLLLAIGLRFSYQEALDWYLRAVALCQSHAEISARLHLRLLYVASNLTGLNDLRTALAMDIQAIEISRSLGPEGKVMLIRSLFKLAERFLDDIHEPDLGVAPLMEAESMLQTLGPEHYSPNEGLPLKRTLAYLKALLANQQGRHLDAKRHAREHIRLLEGSGTPVSATSAQLNMGIACLGLGEYQEAREHFLAPLLGHDPADRDAYNLLWLAKVDLRQGNLERALEYCQESIRQADKLPDRNIIASNLGLIAAIGAKQDQPIQAARLSGASQALYQRQGRKPWEDSSLDTLLPGWRDGPDYAAIAQAFEEGQAMSVEDAVAYALELATDE